jgi:chemotaxis family two-component system sensor kinase Cph1
MPIALVILLFAAVHDIFAAAAITECFYLSEFTYIILILTMAYRLTNNFIDAMNEVEHLNVSLDSIVKERTRELEEKNKTLVILSTTDQLTELYNRRHLEHVLEEKIQLSERYKTPLCTIMMDIDHFKSINDNHGHDVGDQVLKSMSESLSESVRVTDTVGRWGGEEFLILAPETDMDSCLNLAERIRIDIQDKTHASINQITASFGISQFKSGDTKNSLIKRSDEGLYKAKEKGRNRVIVG